MQAEIRKIMGFWLQLGVAGFRMDAMSFVISTKGVDRLPERNAARTPMQWSTEENAGFSRARKTILPVIADGPYGYDKISAAIQRPRPTVHARLGRTHHRAVQVDLTLDEQQGMKLPNLLTDEHSEANGRGQHRIVMEPYGYHWYRAGGLGYLLERTSA